MANTLLTISQITRKAALTLHQKLNFIGNINRGYDDAYAQTGAKIGDTLRIRLPNEYIVRTGATMTASGSSTDIAEQKVDLVVNNIKGVDMYFGSSEMALSLDDFNDRIIDPAMSVLATNIESDVYSNLYKSVYNLVDGDAAAFAFTHTSSARQVLTENLAPPSKRTCILNPTHSTKFMNDTKGLYHANPNLEEQFRDGVLSRIQGFDFYENTVFADHTTGTAPKTTLYTVNGAVTANGSTAVTVQTGTATFKKGDVFTVAGCFRVHPETKVSTAVLQQFVVAADYAGGAGSLTFAPALYTSGARQNVVAAGMANSSAIVKVGAGASETINGSLGFYRDAFAFATADLPLPNGTDRASRAVVDGVSVSMVRDFSISDRTFPCRLDVLYGYAAVRPQLAVRIHADG
jgi:hypothetical protein